MLENMWFAVLTAFDNLWNNFVAFLPQLIGAFIVVMLGWLVAILLSVLAARVVLLFRIDKVLERLNVNKSFKGIGLTLSVDKLVGWIVKWFFIVVFLIAAADILEWQAVTNFLQDVVLYIPNVLIAVVILLTGFVLGSFVSEVIRKAVSIAGLRAGDFLATVGQWAIIIFAFMAALVQLGVASALIETLFTGLVGTLALATGLAFGLGGKEEASRVLKNLRENIAERE